MAWIKKSHVYWLQSALEGLDSRATPKNTYPDQLTTGFTSRVLNLVHFQNLENGMLLRSDAHYLELVNLALGFRLHVMVLILFWNGTTWKCQIGAEETYVKSASYMPVCIVLGEYLLLSFLVLRPSTFVLRINACGGGVHIFAFIFQHLEDFSC